MTTHNNGLHIEPDWELHITKADNGYIVSRIEQLLCGDVKEPLAYRKYYTLVVAGETEDDQDELTHLLYEIASFFDPNHKLDIKRSSDD